MVGAMLVRSFALAVMLAFAGVPAWAHSPYFTQIERIDLPDGTQGELRLLHGDGIFLADPVRVIAVDSQERLIARSEHGAIAHILCKPPGRCVAYLDGRVLEVSPDIEPGPVVSKALSDYGSDERSPLEGSKQPSGFITRPGKLTEHVAANLSIGEKTWPFLLIHALLAAVASLAIVGFVILPYRSGRRALLIAGSIGTLLVIPLLAAVSLYFALLVTITDILWLGSLAIGAGLVFCLVRPRRQPVPA
jgi:hypothetical protein